jgi:antitoxin component YwqK of YwqJK toxin-antitoxin module
MKMKAIYLTTVALTLACACGPKKPETAIKTAYIHRYDVEVRSKEEFLSRGGTGVVVSTERDGTKVHKNFVDGRQHGITTCTFPHSEIIAKVARYENGTLVEETVSYQNGTPKEKRVFVDNTISCTSWYEDGTPRAQEQYIGTLLVEGEYFTNSYESESKVLNLNGTRTLRDPAGDLVGKETISDGKVVFQETYYSNGTPLAQIPIVDGKVEGIKKTYFANGAPKSIEEWQDGELHGATVLFQNGQKIAKVPFVHGKKHGIEIRYKSGTDIVVEEVSWENNVRTGPTVADIEGTKITDWYFNDEKVSRGEYLELSSSQLPSG